MSNFNWATAITTVGLLFTWGKFLVDSEYQRSLFYLEQIKKYFSHAVVLLSEGDNDAIKWHQAIDVSKSCSFS